MTFQLVALADLRRFPASFDFRLTPLERQRLGDFRSDLRGRQFSLGRWLLRRLFVRRNIDPGQPVTVRGRPAFIRSGDIRLAISHSGMWVAAAVADGDWLGLDLELPRRRRHWARIAESCFSRTERQWIGDSAERFHRLWTMKEAWLKAAGSELFGGLNLLELVSRDDGFALTADRPARTWSLPWSGGWMTIVGPPDARSPELFVYSPFASLPVDSAPLAAGMRVLRKDQGPASETVSGCRVNLPDRHLGTA